MKDDPHEAGSILVDSIHAPLQRKTASGIRKPRLLRASHLAAGLLVLSIGGLSAYTALHDDGLSRPGVKDASQPSLSDPAQPAPGPAAKALPTAEAGIDRADRTSGANVVTTMTGDGSVVSTYRPRTRQNDGPVLVDAMQVGQDPRVAALPNESLLENSPYGRLPIVGADGRRPMDQYARPASGVRTTRIAIVVGGLGLSQTGTQRAIKLLPEEVTLAFAASGNSLQRWMQEARRGGHEILLQVPFEPFDYPANDPGPETLLVKKPAAVNLASLHKSMAAITNYTGIMNYQGGRFLSSPEAMAPVLGDVARRGLLFLDDGSSTRSKTADVAKLTQLPYAFGDVQLDSNVDVNAISAKLNELERVARTKGQAIGVASAFDESIDAIVHWSEEASARGIEVVGVASLVTEPEKR